MSLKDDKHMCDNIVAEKPGGEKYRIHSSKPETDTNITIRNITERLESNTVL